MRTRAFVATAVVACTVGWVGRSVFSDEPPPDPSKMKEAFLKLGLPGEEHARLKTLAGEYTARVVCTGFDGKETVTEGTSSFAAVLGDRFLRQEAHGTFDGKPFEGRGVIGYDNAKKKWVSAWVDTVGTGILCGEGEEKEKGKVWEFKATMEGPMGPMTMRDVLTKVSDKELRYESYMGELPKPMMTITYTRK